jgi:hypothetical protein
MERPDWLTRRRAGVLAVAVFLLYVGVTESAVGGMLIACGSTAETDHPQAQLAFETQTADGSTVVEVIHDGGDSLRGGDVLVATGTDPLREGRQLRDVSGRYRAEVWFGPGDAFLVQGVESGTRVVVGVHSPADDGLLTRAVAAVRPCQDLPWREPEAYRLASTRPDPE